MYRIPNLVYANKRGQIFDHTELYMAARSAGFNFVPYEIELVELPKEANLYLMQNTVPVAYNQDTTNMEDFPGGAAVAAILPQPYLRLFLPAYTCAEGEQLPPMAYTAIGWLEEKFVTPALQMDKLRPVNVNSTETALAKAAEAKEKFPKNKLIPFLEECISQNACSMAADIFTGGYECAIPVSMAHCTEPVIPSAALATGCSGLRKLNFTPSSRDIIEVAMFYADQTKKPLITFGSACEGDPVMVAETVAKAIKVIKKNRPDATVSYIGCAGFPDKMKMLYEAGLDSVRLTVNSVNPSTYERFYRPKGFTFDGIYKSIELAHRAGVFVSLGLETLPGLNDRESETQALMDFIEAFKIDLIQMSNLDGDPNAIFQLYNFKFEEIHGIKNMLKLLKKRFKSLKFGYYNRNKDDFNIDFGFPDLKRKSSL